MLAICLALIDNDEDKKNFEKLVEQYERRLYREAFKILHSHVLAEDAVWDAFYRIANCFSKVTSLPVYKMEAYLIITVRNASFKIYNSEKKHFENDSYDDIDDIPDINKLNEYDAVDLAKAIDELEEKYKTVIAYFYYYGHNANETAKLMGISRTAVYKYLKKAKQLLFEKLG